VWCVRRGRGECGGTFGFLLGIDGGDTPLDNILKPWSLKAREKTSKTEYKPNKLNFENFISLIWDLGMEKHHINQGLC